MAQEPPGGGERERPPGAVIGQDAPAVQRRRHLPGQHTVGRDQRGPAPVLRRLPEDQRDNRTTSPVVLASGDTFLNADFGYQPIPLISVIGNVEGMRAALAAAPLVTLYKQYVVRFGLGYTEEPRASVDVVGHRMPLKLRYAKPAGPVTY